jgi:flagellar export protein FliJ
MRRFEFRLEAVLRHRQMVLSERRRQLGQAQAEAAAVEEHIRRMRRSREEHQQFIRAASHGQISRVEMVRLRNYVNSLWMRMVLAGRKLAEANARVAERRRAMVTAHQDVRALEILREKALAVWQYEADREERVFLDDLRPSAVLLGPPTAAGGEA